MQMRNLDGSGYLSGKWVNVRTNTGPAAYSTSNTFIYGRADDRRFDLNLTVEQRRGEVHFDGQIWSQALWEIRKGYETNRLRAQAWDTTLVDSQFDYAPDTSFSAAARAIYAKALTRDGRAAADLVRDRFAARHITF